MDKYELNIKMEQIKKLARQKDYAAAATVADSVDFYRIKDNKMLSLIADVYEASGKYEQAKDVLIEAYARTSIGRRLAYRLVKVCIKSGNVSEAEEFYQDFIEAAPRDNSKYILQYELASAKGAPMEDRIAILETYLEDEMDDRWSFELAKLYHKTGQKDKCVKQCDDIILWFNEGKYVDKAMELKMIYAPLTKAQQAKYEERWIAKAPSNIKVDEIKVKEFDAANRYNTVNIQKALKESMAVIMDEKPDSENEEEKSTDNEKQSEQEKTKAIFTDEVINSLLSRTVKDVRVPESKYNTVPLSPYLDMDSSGQIEMSIEEPVDDQIEGQMTIGDLLEAYEKREATRTSGEDNIGEKEVISSVRDISEAEYTQEESDIIEETRWEETIPEDKKEEVIEVQEPESISDDIEEIREEEAVSEQETTEENKMSHSDEMEAIMSVTADLSVVEAALVEAAAAKNESDDDQNIIRHEDNQESLENHKDEYNPSEEEAELTRDEEEEFFDEDVKEETEEENQAVQEKQEDNDIVKELIKEFVTKYSGVQGLDRQLLAVLQEALINDNAHIIVMGEIKSGKTSLAIDLVKVVNKIRQVRGRKIAKINGEVLNEKNVSEYFDKLSGMDIIIEKAGILSETTANDILERINNDSENKIVVLEDEKTNAENLINSNKKLAEMFSCRVVVKQNKIRDWAVVAKDYAKEKGYEIDEMGVLALSAKIDELYAISLVINKSQVETIINNAINKSGRRGFGKLLKLFGKEREKVLKEEDFS